MSGTCAWLCSSERNVVDTSCRNATGACTSLGWKWSAGVDAFAKVIIVSLTDYYNFSKAQMASSLMMVT